MILLRMFWALFLAGMVAYTFNRSWRWEHGEPMPETLFGSDKPRTKETIDGIRYEATYVFYVEYPE